MPDLYGEFLVEASGHLETIERWLSALVEADVPPDATPARRAAHSLKGAARMVGAPKVAELAARMEVALAALGCAAAPDLAAAKEAQVLCSTTMSALEAAAPGVQPDAGPLAAEPVSGTGQWDGLRKALPVLPEILLESLTDFQCAESLRLLAEGYRFWLVYVDSASEAIESTSDQAVAWLRTLGQVISQSMGISSRQGYDYTLTVLFAGKLAPAPRADLHFPVRIEEIPVADHAVAQTAPPPSAAQAETVEAVEVDPQLQEIFLASADNLVQELTDAIATAERSPDSTEALDALFRAGHSLKGAGTSFGFPVVSYLGREMEQVLDRVRRRQLAFDDVLLDALYTCVDTLGAIISQARDGTLDQKAPLPVVDELRRLAAGGSAEARRPGRPSPVVAGLSAHALGRAIHLSVEAADRLLDRGRDAWLAAETSWFVAPPEGEFRESIDRTRTSILALVDAILATRMQPVSHILRAYPRLVREVCREQNKRVNLDIVGAEVQMDRLLLEAINDPIVHLVRNALDHGIETVEERQRLGKQPEGTLAIRVSADRGTVTIEIRDDGRGVNSEALKRKAVEAGKITEEAAKSLTEAQALDLMFIPGVSTRETVGELSGRGVGLDVVRSNIEQVRGRIEVSTRLGSGTAVRLRLPLTAAILHIVQTSVAGMPLCLPTAAVERVVAVNPSDKQAELRTASGVSELVPLVPARRYVAPDSPGGTEAEAVILRSRVRVAGLLVDRVEEERPVLVTDLGGLISRTRWVGACTLLADGRVAPILDTSAVLESVGRLDVEEGRGEVVEEPPAPRTDGPPVILAVDDSPTMRQLMRNVLELAGYRVQLAADGESALEALGKELPRLVLADVAMPGMGGLTLVREIRRRWPRLTVAIVSGRDHDSDRKAGLEAGAHAYIVKGASDRRGLIASVARLLAEGPRS